MLDDEDPGYRAPGDFLGVKMKNWERADLRTSHTKPLVMFLRISVLFFHFSLSYKMKSECYSR